MTDHIEGKIVVITGASSGLGEAAARHLAAQGAKIVLGARRAHRLEALVEDIVAAGGEALAVQTDVTNRAVVSNLVDTAVRVFGRIDVLSNNAGIMPLSALESLKVDEWDRMIDVNIKGVLYGIAAALPHMKKQRSGHVITTSSVAGHLVFPASSVYSGTKFAVRAICEGFRQEVKPYGIRTTILCRGGRGGDHQCVRAAGRTRRPLRPCQPHSLGQAPVVLRHPARSSEGTIVMRRHTGSGVKALCAIAIAAVPLLTSCAKGTGMAATPQKGIHTSMLSHDDVASVSPALERYRREALEASLWQRPQLSPRDRSIVTIAALIARNQTAEQAHYLARALDNGVRPPEISEIITHLAFYAGWGNAMATVQIAQGVFETRGISRSALPPAAPPLLPLDQAAEAQRAALVEATVTPVAPGLVAYTSDVLFKDLWLRPALAPRDRSLVTVSALIASGQVGQVTYHLNRAMDSGLTQEEAGEVITHLAFYAGWPNAFSAVPVAKDVFDKRPR